MYLFRVTLCYTENSSKLLATKYIHYNTVINLCMYLLRLATGLDDALKIVSVCISNPLRLDLLFKENK